MYSASDSSIICFAKTTACSSSRNRFRSVPIFSPYSKTQTMSDSSLNSNCASSFSTVIDDAPGAGQNPEAMKGGVSLDLAETLEPPACANKMAPNYHSTFMPKWLLVGAGLDKRSLMPLFKNKFRNMDGRMLPGMSIF